MTAIALALLTQGAFIAIVVSRLLARATWPPRVPRSAAVLWFAMPVSVLTSVLTAAALLSLPVRPLWHGVDSVAWAPMSLVRAAYCPSTLPRPVAVVALALLWPSRFAPVPSSSASTYGPGGGVARTGRGSACSRPRPMA